MFRAIRLFVLFLVAGTAPLAAQRSQRARPSQRSQRARPSQRSQRARPSQRAQAALPTPASILGFVPGTERRLVEWDTIVRYFRALDAASNRVRVREIGRTTNGAPFIVAYISSPANLARLPRLRALQARLADPRTVRDSAELARLIARAPTFVLITSGVHSTEIGGSLKPLEIAWQLATSPIT